jgi:hypothetical protein
VEQKLSWPDIAARYPKFAGEVVNDLQKDFSKARRIIKNVENGIFPGKY